MKPGPLRTTVRLAFATTLADFFSSAKPLPVFELSAEVDAPSVTVDEAAAEVGDAVGL